MGDDWQALTPDAQSATPLYLQLASRLASAIHAGTRSAGEALPAERTLSEAVGVSRITARKALALLVEQGLIRRARGAGSFITPRTEDPLSRLTGFTRKWSSAASGRIRSGWIADCAQRIGRKRCVWVCLRARPLRA